MDDVEAGLQRYKLLTFASIALVVLGFGAAFTFPDAEAYDALERLGFLTTAIGFGTYGGALVRYRKPLSNAENRPRSVYASGPTLNVLTSVVFFWVALAFAAGAVL